MIPLDYVFENAVREVARYEGICVGDYDVTKNHGDYIEICVDADNCKGHVSFDLYFDDNGKLIRWELHS